MKPNSAATLATPEDERLLTSKELLTRIPLNRATVYRMVQEKRFPAPVQITANRIAWRLSDVLAWIADRQQNPITPRPYFSKRKAAAR
jgi:prophage regulatory protein